MSAELIRPDLLCFREGKRSFRTAELLAGIADCFARLQRADSSSRRELLLELLLRCGELECGIADVSTDPDVNAIVAAATDRAAEALLAPTSPRPHLDEAVSSLLAIPHNALPTTVTLSKPEGFAYYALHPLDYADRLTEERELTGEAAVVGIRSIGTTLSALVAAYLRTRGADAPRISVRPTGHPFERELHFSPEQRNWVQSCAANNAHFYVVDEGPGISGSSFLSVAEALEREGVAPERITLFSSAEPNLASLRAANAAARWQRFRSLHTHPTRHCPADAAQFFGADQWRKRAFTPGGEWPGCWPHMERLKYLSPNEQTLYRFDGYAHYGAAVRARYAAAAVAGFGPECRDAGDGFTAFDMLRGEAAQHVSPELLYRAADYCAWRADALRVAADEVDLVALEHMTRINIERALGMQPPDDFHLEVMRPVLADAKMQLHEWLRTEEGKWLKLDSAAHGDDHFFPGPCDIAWDIAGVIVEWDLDSSARADFLSHYERVSGDDVSARLRSWLLAYAAFRLGYCATASLMMAGTPDAERLTRDANRYERSLRELLSRGAAQVAS